MAAREGAEPPPTVVLHVFGRMDRGGSETRSVEMLEHLDKNKVRTIYCTLARDNRPGTLDETIRERGGEVLRCPLESGFGRRFKAILRREGVTALHGHVQNFSGLLAYYSWQERVAIRIVHWHTTGASMRSFAKRIQDRIMKLLVGRFATRIVSVGEGAMEANWPCWRDDPRCKVLYSGVDLRRFAKASKTRSELNLGEDSFVVAHVGRFNPVKNQLFLLEVFREILASCPQAALLLLGGGEGEYAGSIEARARELGIYEAIHFCGVVPEVADYLPAADLMVFPSVHEGLPGSVLEAVAAGVPVLASDLPGVREIEKRVPGVQSLSLSRSAGDWATQALALADQYRSPDQRQGLVAALKTSDFNLESCVAGHLEVWEGR